MANKYRSVLASGGGVQPTGNAQPADVLAGKTFSNAEGINKVGTMVNNGAVSATVAAGQNYTIPAGYHNGSGTVSASYAPTATLLFHENAGTTRSYTFTDDYDLVFAIVSGGGNSAFNYTGSGITIGSDNTGGTATNNYTAVIKDVKSNDSINSGNGTALLIIYGINFN